MEINASNIKVVLDVPGIYNVELTNTAEESRETVF